MISGLEDGRRLAGWENFGENTDITDPVTVEIAEMI